MADILDNLPLDEIDEALRKRGVGTNGLPPFSLTGGAGGTQAQPVASPGRPTMPQVSLANPPQPPPMQAPMPQVSLSGQPAQPQAPAAPQAPQLHGWKKALDIAGQIAAPGIEQQIPGTPGNFRLNQRRDEAEQARQTALQGQQLGLANTQSEIAERNARTEAIQNPPAKAEKPEKPEDVVHSYSNALATGDTAEAARLKPLVQEFLNTTKPVADKPEPAFEDDRRYRDIQAKQSMKQPISPEDAAWAKAYEKQKTLSAVTGGNLRIEGLAQSREYQQYDNKLGVTVPVNAEEINRAAREEPGRYTAPQFTTEAQTAAQTGKAFAAGGKAGEELTAFNTAIAHADLLGQAAKALKNGDTKVLNSIKNRLATELGVPDASNFVVIANAYTREVTKALSGGHITDQEIKTQGATIPDNASPAQIAGAIEKYKQLMQSKVQQRKEQYDTGKAGKPNFAPGGGGNRPPLESFEKP